MTYSESSVPDQRGKTFFITGANTGIGLEAARVLAGRGARVLLGCRSEEKARHAIDRIVEEHPEADATWIPLDLTRLKSVAAALGTETYPRRRVGIGGAERRGAVSHVLGRFDKEERAAVEAAIDHAARTARLWVECGIDEAMNKCNRQSLGGSPDETL